ncbi:MAG: DM13 domain-containing protein [Pseudomonadales bacterium]
MKNTILSLSLAVLAMLNAAHSPLAHADTAVASGDLQHAFSSWGSPSLQGDWQIVEDNGAHFIELSDNFKAKKGPDVKIFLSPTPAEQITGSNAVTGSVFVTLISDFKGKARIAIPAGTDISAFQSLVFHCEEYSKLWGSSTLR